MPKANKRLGVSVAIGTRPNKEIKNKKTELKPKPKKKRGIFYNLFKILALFSLFIIFCGIMFFFWIIRDLPRPEVFTENKMVESTKIYDRTGEILLSDIYNEEKRTYVSLSQIPDILKNAVIATEDHRFYNHFGIDVAGIVRVIISNVKTGNAHGASTITQQLIRSTFLTPDKKINRKIKEILLSIELDRQYSKDQILEWYLNQVPFGVNIYGAEEASMTYFKKPVQDLELQEAAMLAAIIQLPSYYSPYGQHFDELIARKDFVLRRMREEGYINREQEQAAKEKEIKISKSSRKILAYHFVEYVKEQVEEMYGEDFLQTKGLRIYTTLNWDLQKSAEETVKESVAKNRANYNAYNQAAIIMSPKTGEVLAMVGSADPWADPLPKGCDPAKTCKFVPSYNVAVQAIRQPGSSIKPIIYASAFRNGFNDQTIIIDEPTCFGTYCPNNYDGSFRGALTLRQSLAMSLNIPAVKTLNDYAGLNETISLAQTMGLTTLEDKSRYGLSFALGAADVRVIDMATAYSVFANGGYYLEPSVILKIEDSQGNLLFKNKKTPRKVLEKNVCDMITDVLSDNNARAPMFGQNSLLRFDNYKVSVKTGTTQDSVDGWTAGFTSETVVVVWAGNNNRAKMSSIGLQAAGPTWRSLILKSIELNSQSSHQETFEPVEPGTEVPLYQD
ncbi:MAG: PBP1A family penicillin-binding protein [Candidatus Paceibacterota bacterium]